MQMSLDSLLYCDGQMPKAKVRNSLTRDTSDFNQRGSDDNLCRFRTHIFYLRLRGEHARKQVQRVPNSFRNAYCVPRESSDSDSHGDTSRRRKFSILSVLRPFLSQKNLLFFFSSQIALITKFSFRITWILLRFKSDTNSPIF